LLSFFWGGHPTALKVALPYAPPIRQGWMRFLLSGLVILIWAKYRKVSLIPAKHELSPLIQLGILFSVQLLFLNYGISKTTVASSVVLNSTYPIWVITLGHFFIKGDTLNKFKFFGVLIAYAGIVVTYIDSFGNTDFIIGNSLCLISGFLLGVRSIFLAKNSHSIPPLKLLASQAVFGTVVFLILSLIIETDPYKMSLILITSILYQGAIVAGFNFIANIWLLKTYKPSQVVVIHLSQPIFGIFIGKIILHETIGSTVILGTLLIILGSILVRKNENYNISK
jgi:drug/metabolite transporter (DMT)-like permease